MACFVGQQLPFDEASETLLRVGGIRLSDKQLERICHAYGAILDDELYEDEVVSDTLYPNPTQPVADHSGMNYVEIDGSMAFLRAEPTLGTEAGWREVKLARLFASDDILEAKKRTTIRHSDYVLHLGDHRAFTTKLTNRLGGRKSLIALSDGARWIWDYWDTYHPQAIQILDYFHVVEKLGEWAKVHFKVGAAGESWMQNCFARTVWVNFWPT
jgi:hypothetical protein